MAYSFDVVKILDYDLEHVVAKESFEGSGTYRGTAVEGPAGLKPKFRPTREPRSKKKRIQNKWRLDWRNLG